MSEVPSKNLRLNLSGAISIKHVEIDSISSVRKLQYDSYNKEYARYATESETAAFIDNLESSKFAEDLQRIIAKRQMFGAFLDHRMVGIASWSDSRDNQLISRLRFLFVDPFFTRCGVGRTLLGTLEETVRSEHSREFSIRTVVQSMGFFEKASYLTTSYGALPVGNDEAFAVAFMRKAEEENESDGNNAMSMLYH